MSNKLTKTYLEEMVREVLNEKQDEYKPHDMYNPKTGEKYHAKREQDHTNMAAKGYTHIDPDEIRKIIGKGEGGAAGIDPFLEEFGKDMEEEIIKTLEGMPDIGQHKNGDYVLADGENIKISEGMNCGCGNDPCKTFGKNNEKLTVYINEEFENYMEESLYYGLIEEEEDEAEERREDLISRIYDIMMDNRTGNDEEDFEAAKDEILKDMIDAAPAELDAINLKDILQMGGALAPLEEKKKKKKGCKPSKGKKYARRVKGKCVSYGAKGYKIAPGTSKGNSYCARSYGDMKSHGKDCSGKDRSTPLCLSRKKWKCSGKYSRKGK